MHNIDTHIDHVVDGLSKLPPKAQSQFGAWCVNGLFSQDKIRANLTALTGSLSAINTIESAIQYIWEHDYWDTTVLAGLINDLEMINWDEDCDLMDDPATQGSIELLGATSSMLHGVIESDPRLIANCGEMAINWYDNMVNFSESDDGAAEQLELENEYARQEQFLMQLADQQ